MECIEAGIIEWNFQIWYGVTTTQELEVLHYGEPSMNDAQVGTKFRWGKWAVGEHFGAVNSSICNTVQLWELEIEPEIISFC